MLGVHACQHIAWGVNGATPEVGPGDGENRRSRWCKVAYLPRGLAGGYAGVAVNLADFIVGNMESILQQWEEFAKAQVPAAANMNSLALRDHAQQILEAVARDIVRPQTPRQQEDSSGASHHI